MQTGEARNFLFVNYNVYGDRVFGGNRVQKRGSRRNLCPDFYLRNAYRSAHGCRNQRITQLIGSAGNTGLRGGHLGLSGFQIGVRVVVSPFPFDDDATFLSVSKHAAILFKKGIPEEVHIEDVMQVNGQWYVAGTLGVVLVVCGVGQTMRQAQAQAYSRIRNIMIPDMYYRDDIGERWFEDHDKLHTWGYLREV